MQTKVQSLIEAITNTFIGYWISVGVGQIVYPMFGYPVSVYDNMGLTAIFVAVSLTRSYVFRRGFNWLHRDVKLLPSEESIRLPVGVDMREK